jgi:hypothetical protein
MCLHQCWASTQFGRLELPVLVLVSKTQTRTGSDFWNQVQKPELGSLFFFKEPETELESRSWFFKEREPELDLGILRKKH